MDASNATATQVITNVNSMKQLCKLAPFGYHYDEAQNVLEQTQLA